MMRKHLSVQDEADLLQQQVRGDRVLVLQLSYGRDRPRDGEPAPESALVSKAREGSITSSVADFSATMHRFSFMQRVLNVL